MGIHGSKRIRLQNDRAGPLQVYLEPTGFIVTIPSGQAYDFDLSLEPEGKPIEISVADHAVGLYSVVQAYWSTEGRRLGQWPWL